MGQAVLSRIYSNGSAGLLVRPTGPDVEIYGHRGPRSYTFVEQLLRQAEYNPFLREPPAHMLFCKCSHLLKLLGILDDWL